MTESPRLKPSRLSSAALLLVTTLGVPAGIIGLTDDHLIHDYPWIGTCIAIISGVLALFAGIFVQVWSGLGGRWVDRLTNWIDRWLMAKISRFRRRYIRWLFYQHRDFDVKGLSTQGIYNLELEQVFVDLSIEPKAAHATSSDPIRPVPENLTGRRQIWDYLRNKDFEDNLVLIGAPGSGKTTLLKKIALNMASNRRPRLGKTVPVLLFLREHAEAIQEHPNYSIAEAIKASLSRKGGPVPPEGWLERSLESGRCLILLDGLDEVAAPEIRSKVVAWVESRMKASPRNRFLITSRPHGYRSNPISGITVLEVQPFDRGQIRSFVSNWYLANEIRASARLDPGVKSKAREGAEDLLRRLGNSQTLTALSVNPLLLTMIATVHRFRSSLPGRRVELYSEICEVFLGKRQQARGIENDLTPSQKQRVLQPLAFQLMCSQRRELALAVIKPLIIDPLQRVAGDKGSLQSELFLKGIESGSGLLLEREVGIYSFAHLAFQEYLAAVHAREQGLGDDLLDKVADPWWHETLRLYGALGDASPILAACFSSEETTVPQLSLAIDCLEESLEVDPEWRRMVDHLLQKGAEDDDPDKFRLASQTILARRLQNFVGFAEDVLVDPTFVTHAEYQLFLDESRSRGRNCQPDHWLEYRFAAGHALKPAVGVRPTDAQEFCMWLSDRDPGFRFRLPRLAEAETIESTSEPGGPQAYWLTSSADSTSIFVRKGQRINLPEGYVAKFIGKDFVLALAITLSVDLDLHLIKDFLADLQSSLSRHRERLWDRARKRGLYGVYHYAERERDVPRERAKERALHRDISRAVDHASRLDEVCRMALDSVPELATRIDRPRELAHVPDRSRYIDSAVTLSRSLVQHLVSLRSLVEQVEQARAAASQTDRELHDIERFDLERDRALERELDRYLQWARSLDRAEILDRILDRKAQLELDRLTRRPGQFEIHALARWHGRAEALMSAASRFQGVKEPISWWRFSRDKSLPPQNLLSRYLSLLNLEARIEGVVHAAEGIRLVKERRA